MVKELGVRFVRGKVAKIESRNGNPVVVVENTETGEIEEEEYDMVVLSVGLLSNPELAEILGVEVNPYGFFSQPEESTNPAITNVEGIFVAGTATCPKDIPDTVAEAAAAAAQCIAYIKEVGS